MGDFSHVLPRPFETNESVEKIGRKFDADKTRWDLVPMEVIEEIAKVLTFGAKKYEPNNWQHVPDFKNRYFASLMRHLVAHRSGITKDEESGMSHLSHALCCLVFLAWEEKQNSVPEEGV